MPSPQRPSDSYQDRHAYIPPQVEQAMVKQMEHALPAHMKKYAGAYVQQNMTGPGMANSGKVSGPPPGYRPVTHLPRKDHFHQYKAQIPSKADTFVQQPTAPQTQQTQAQPAQPYQEPAAPSPEQPPMGPMQAAIYDNNYQAGPQSTAQPAYDFIMNPDQAAGLKTPFLSGSSLIARIGLVAGGLIILLVVFNIARGLLSGPSTVPYYLSVVQDQQAIIHLTSTTSQPQTDISEANKNFSTTAQLSVASSQSAIIRLLAQNGEKIKTKEIGLKVSGSDDQRISAAATSGTYNETFREIMQSHLKTYMADLQKTYDKSKGANGRALISDQFHQAELLNQQLNPSE